MSQVITAPNSEKPIFISLFLAGGITNCRDWQNDVIKELVYDDVSIFNPRQEHFDISNKSASYEQIAWEYERLEQMDIFSMYFCNSDSDQPICMYELGRNIVRMQNRFPVDWQERIIIDVEDGYRRKSDVIIQMKLCAPSILVNDRATPETHAQRIQKVIRKLNTSVTNNDYEEWLIRDRAPAYNGS